MENLDENSGQGNATLSTQARETLESAAGWAKAMGIIGVVLSGIAIIFGLIALFASPLFGIIYIVIYGIFLYVWLLLVNQAGSITRGQFNIEKFAGYYKKFWKLSVIILIVSVVLGIIGGIYVSTTVNNLQSGGGFPF